MFRTASGRTGGAAAPHQGGGGGRGTTPHLAGGALAQAGQQAQRHFPRGGPEAGGAGRGPEAQPAEQAERGEKGCEQQQQFCG